ncbi:MAG: DUF58 domain-containing protein [Bacteroidota bacterium]|nr:DUF58 domain-containing protein [Bacteroidota bacterium]
MKDLIKKLRKFQIQIRKAITSQMQGDFHSIFKGSGLEFDEVRAYQYGDDVRAIDWKVSAKGHGTFVRTYKEEKEQSVMFLLDVSASQEIGSEGSQKLDIAKEICGILTLSAIEEGSQVGLICFSDQKELHLKPGKGEKHAYKIVSLIQGLKPASKRTDLNKSILYTLGVLKKKSVVIMLSDFIDDNFEHNFQGLAKKHDLVIIHISDVLETSLPGLGIVPLYDKESNKTIWVNTSSKEFREKMENNFSQKFSYLESLSRKNQADYLHIDSKENYIPKLIKLFQVRNKSKKSA